MAFDTDKQTVGEREGREVGGLLSFTCFIISSQIGVRNSAIGGYPDGVVNGWTRNFGISHSAGSEMKVSGTMADFNYRFGCLEVELHIG